MSGLQDRHLLGGAAAACAVCCAAPIVGLLGATGVAATGITLAFAGAVFAVVVGFATVAAVLVRHSRARRASCAVPPAAGAVLVPLGQTRAGGHAGRATRSLAQMRRKASTSRQ